MMITPFHAKYYANELLRHKADGSDDRISSSLFDAALEVNPHQIDAALFAFQTPLSKGVLLADEVGLGKTIEAGLAMCQLWAERKRKQIVICPASLRKQWSLELMEKFNMPSVILESKTYKDFQKKGMINPFKQNSVVIISYNYAVKMHEKLRSIPWDVVIMDEAHKLRNCYKPSNRAGNVLKATFQGCWKMLLTATPLQNNLAELYGLSSVIDEHIFGDLKSFRSRYIRQNHMQELKGRLSSFCKRTLRKDVMAYIKYTERFPIVKEFMASDEEQKLYEGISDFLQRPHTYAIPTNQKQLTTLVIRKVLASSTWAVIQTLRTILERLESLREGKREDENIEDLLDDDQAQLLEEEDEDQSITINEAEEKIDMKELDEEIKAVKHFIHIAQSIPEDTKSHALLEALQLGFKKTAELGGNKKALIFTESRRTQDHLVHFLESNGYEGKIVTFNGTNSSKENTRIYKEWKKENEDTGRISGSTTADKRNALIEYFRDKAEIMIATESAAEGVNLQFCSLVINYDLPWNPQRIEQRIGRCHRYGQKNDVVVINFINKRNYADVRVHELLDEKFNLFRGVFGSSDEVLGSVESGVDFEKKILEIYQKCRTHEEIKEQFDALQKEMDGQIKKSMRRVRDELFANFDADVQSRLKLSAMDYLDKYSRYFWALTQYELRGQAVFEKKNHIFELNAEIPHMTKGRYALISKTGNKDAEGIVYRLSHPLGQYVLQKGMGESWQRGSIIFDITHDKGYKNSQVEQLKGQKGCLTLYKYTIIGLEKEDYLLFAGYKEDGTSLDAEQCSKLFECGGTWRPEAIITEEERMRLKAAIEQYVSGVSHQADERNLKYFKEEEQRLNQWANDLIDHMEDELDQTKRNIRDTTRALKNATSIEEHLKLEETLKSLSRKKRTLRDNLEENEDELERKRDALIDELKTRMKTTSEESELFTIHWKVV